jgi:hypothetical protein
MKIDVDTAARALRAAIDFEMPDAAGIGDRIFDELAYQLRRLPQFRGMPIIAIDLAIHDVRRELITKLNQAFESVERRLVQSFKDEIGFGEGEAA